ncbi:MAG: hypothetical protein HY078_16055 [Elusimicrobia bacterium]|nr:hypothetical protein [Elusimicrobiota bacterium]
MTIPSAARQALAALALLPALAFAQPDPCPGRVVPDLETPKDIWRKILERVAREGVEERAVPGEDPDRKTIAEVQPPGLPPKPEVDHVNHWIIAWGGVHPETGLPGLLGVRLLVDEWKMGADGDWRFDSWLLHLHTDGSLIDYDRREMVQTRQQRVLSSGSLTCRQDTAARIKEKYEELIAYWSGPAVVR